jgi:hypothetical protein
VASDCDDPCSAANPDGESCIDDVCAAGGGCTDLGPVITAIDGVGDVNADSNPATAEHHVGSGLRITGAGLAGAGARLAGPDGSDQELSVDSSTDGELIACLPAGTAAGVYTVTVANQAGAACGDFELVQGAVGPEGPAGTYTGAEIVSLVGNGFDDRFVNVSGDAMTGELSVDGGVAVGRGSAGADLDVRGLLDSPLTGVVTVTASSTEVLGGGTSFQSELRVGDALMIAGEIYEVASIADDTHLTLATAATASAAGVSATRDRSLFRVQNGAGTDVFRINRSGWVIGLGLERVDASCSGITCSADALCPAGKKAIGGGCRISSCSQNGYDYNYPLSDLSGWRCQSNECSTTNAYAICARVQ